MVCRVPLVPEGLLARELELSVLHLAAPGLVDVEGDWAVVELPSCRALVSSISRVVGDLCTSSCTKCRIPASMGTTPMIEKALSVALKSNTICDIVDLLDSLAAGDAFGGVEAPAIPLLRLEFREFARTPVARKLRSRDAVKTHIAAQLLALLGYCATIAYTEVGRARCMLLDETMVSLASARATQLHSVLRALYRLVYSRQLDPILFALLAAGEAAEVGCGTSLTVRIVVLSSSNRGVNLLGVEDSPVPELHASLCSMHVNNPEAQLVQPLVALISSGAKEASDVAERFARMYTLGVTSRSLDYLLAAERIVSNPLASGADWIDRRGLVDPIDAACHRRGRGMRLSEALAYLSKLVHHTLLELSMVRGVGV